jgi:hypothetical protein
MAIPPINGPCSDVHPQATLLQMRVRLMRRLGFSAQATTPPPGMAELLTDFLAEAQVLVYSDYATFRTRRFYEWPLVVGERFYAYGAGNDGGSCTKTLDPEKIDWVGVSQNESTNDAGFWETLIKGINPIWYSSPGSQTGWPTNYEIGQYIEVYPPPTASGGRLRVKGNFNLAAFAVDADVTTIDPETIFLRALANAKFHYNQPDAGNYRAQEEMRVMNLIAASHATGRYIPIPDAGMVIGEGVENPNGVIGAVGTRYTEGADVRLVD